VAARRRGSGGAIASGGARVWTQGGIKIFLGRQKRLRKFFDDLFCFTPSSYFFHQHHPRGAVRGVLGAPFLLARAPGGMMPPASCLRHWQLPPGARRRGRQNRVVSAKEGATNMTFAPPGARNPGAATGHRLYCLLGRQQK
jgi:hypothetical protein